MKTNQVLNFKGGLDNLIFKPYNFRIRRCIMRTLNKIHLVFAILSLFSNAYAQSKIVWLSYPTAGCITCHRIASVKMNDTLYLIGSFHYQNNKSNPFIIAIDSQLNVKILWLR